MTIFAENIPRFYPLYQVFLCHRQNLGILMRKPDFLQLYNLLMGAGNLTLC